MHSGTGRISKLVMYPMSLYESLESNGKISLKKLFLEIKSLIQKANTENNAGIKEPTLLIVITGGEMAYTRDDGVKIIPIGTLKD